jgi:hypothetical protein
LLPTWMLKLHIHNLYQIVDCVEEYSLYNEVIH